MKKRIFVILLFGILFVSLVYFLWNQQSFTFTPTGYTPFEISTASYDNVNISTQDTQPRDLFFKPDGTKLYELGTTNNLTYQYTCSDAWNLSSCSYDNINLSTQDDLPGSIFFKPDGTKLYEMGVSNDLIYQYTCTDAWNLSSCSYDNVNLSTQDGSPGVPEGLFFKSDGTKLYEIGAVSDLFFQYDCSDPWNLSSCIYENINISTQDGGPRNLFFKDDGTKLYEIGNDNDSFYQYDCSDPWNLSSCNYDNLSISTQDTDPKGLFIKPDGTKLYEIGIANGGLIYQYTFSTISVNLIDFPTNNTNYSTSPITINFSANVTRSSISLGIVNVSLLINDVVNQTVEHAWNLSTATWDGSDTNLSVASQDASPTGLTFKPDGTKLYVVGDLGNKVYQYSLSTPWSLSTATWDGSDTSLSVASQDGGPQGLTFKPDGTKLYVVGQTNDKVYQYSCSAWNVSSCSWDGPDTNLSVASQDVNPRGLTFKPNGTKLYVVGDSNNRVYQYSLSTPWNLSTATWDGSDTNLSVASQDLGPTDLFFKPDGTKLYVGVIGGDRG
jgi:sugar lactone lactonase YvrE